MSGIYVTIGRRILPCGPTKKNDRRTVRTDRFFCIGPHMGVCCCRSMRDAQAGEKPSPPDLQICSIFPVYAMANWLL